MSKGLAAIGLALRCTDLLVAAPDFRARGNALPPTPDNRLNALISRWLLLRFPAAICAVAPMVALRRSPARCPNVTHAKREMVGRFFVERGPLSASSSCA